MNKDQAWKDHSDGERLQYDFLPPGQWGTARLVAEQKAIAALLAEADSGAAAEEPGSLRLARRLPDALRAALVAELRHGNQIAGIGSMGWPNQGSVVVTLHERFSTARKATPPGVVWREINDPHYWREDMSQNVDGVEFLMIT